ncbi:MAG: diaminopimelate epimerase [Micrococcales bacterium]|nr:diaminopimelate epimerase [Micrococcales bacterium]
MTTLAFTKGHGTGNDFVLVADPDGVRELDPADAARLADRRSGVGGDGVIRAVRSQRFADGAAALAEDPAAEWFMDYRNADGSAAEMCGNGIRVFGEFLLAEGLAEVAVGETMAVGTRAGVRALTRTGEGWSADLGRYRVRDDGVTVSARNLRIDRPAVSVEIGNPHAVVALADDEELDEIDLTIAPGVLPLPADGVNVEFVVPDDPLVVGGRGGIRLRVHERGSGETLSCGTGAAAAAIATRFWAGDRAPAEWRVVVPGGVLGVALRDGRATLSGPAELVYSGVIDLG